MTTVKLYSEYCRKLVKANDYDRYLVSLCAKREDQKYLWALFAFNYEIAKTKEVVTENQLGLIRLKWWSDEIEKIYNNDSYKDNQILPLLAEAIRQKNIDKDMLMSLIEAREHDLIESSEGTIDELVTYADCTNTPLLMLISQICNIDVSYNSLTSLGISYGLAGIMLSLPYTNKEILSDDIKIMHEEGVRNLDIYNQQDSIQPLKAVSKIATLNLAHVKKCNFSLSHRNYTKPILFKSLRATI